MKKTRLYCLAALLLGFAAPPGAALAGSRDLVVVELYTSQGCSSCPPADRYAADLAKRGDVVMLSFPVDYWDYLGWKDSLADPAFTRRQRDYARFLGERHVYTPQMVINGRTHASGGSRRSVGEKIAAQTGHALRVVLRQHNGQLQIKVFAGGAKAEKGAVIWLAGVLDRYAITPAAGENAGSALVYTNIVRTLEEIGSWRGGDITLRRGWQAGGGIEPVVFIQDRASGHILGVARLTKRAADQQRFRQKLPPPAG